MSHIIHDENFIEYVRQDSGFMPRESQIGKLEGVPLFAEQFALIPENEWADRVKVMNDAKAFVRHRYEEQKPVHQNQNGLSYCWTYSLTQGIEMARAITDLPYHQLAPEGLGYLVGWRNAGYFCDKAIIAAAKTGVPTREYIKQYSLDYRNYKTGWQDNALLYRPVEYYDLGGENMWREVVTAIISGFAVYTGYNVFAHAITLDSLAYVNNELCVSSPNTWNGAKDRWTLAGSKKIPDEAFAIRTVTYSDK